MRYLSFSEVIRLHQLVIAESGGASGIHDLGALESCVAQPQMTFGGQELYPTIEAKATSLCFSIVMNHPFADGNKRVGHAAMETFLVLNGLELVAGVDNAEQVILSLAAHELSREGLLNWVRSNVRPLMS
ncbi:MAG: type II toxin-antitoxin system death-on-curing family toxin [Thermoguttaceae bacterium]|jgi:death-on-curing protein